MKATKNKHEFLSDEEIQQAVEKGDLNIVKQIKKGLIDINQRFGRLSKTLLHLSVVKPESLPLLTALLELPGILIDPFAKGNFTPLQYAASEGNWCAIKILIQHGADYNIVHPVSGNLIELLSAAYHQELIPKVKELIEQVEKQKKKNEQTTLTHRKSPEEENVSHKNAGRRAEETSLIAPAQIAKATTESSFLSNLYHFFFEKKETEISHLNEHETLLKKEQ